MTQNKQQQNTDLLIWNEPLSVRLYLLCCYRIHLL